MSNEFEQPVEPMSRTEDLLRTGTEEPVIAMSEIEKILRGEHIDRPHSRVADLLLQYNPSDILIEKRIEENGTYYATADAADGYYKVVVDTPVVPPTVLEHLVETVSTNGTHTFTPGTGVDGFSDASITVSVAPNVGSKNITQNGNYAASSDNLDGYSNVNVNVAPNVGSKNIIENGTYNASSDNLDGYSQVVVDVDPPQNSYAIATATTSMSDAEQLPVASAVVSVTDKDKAELFLTSDGVVSEDNTPYTYRPSPSGKSCVDLSVVGGTVAWNQLVQNGNFASTANWSTFRSTLTVNNNVGTLTLGARPVASAQINQAIEIPANHKIMLCGELNSSVAGDISIRTFKTSSGGGTINAITVNVQANTWTKYNVIRALNTDITKVFAIYAVASENSTLQLKNIQIIDLTQMFGSTIADYIYSLEQATAGSGIAWLKANGFLTKDYYAYDAGSLQSVKTSGRKIVGFNQLDENLFVADKWLYATNGNIQDVSGRYATVEYTPCMPSTRYYFLSIKDGTPVTATYELILCWYDENKNFISCENANISTRTQLSPPNAHYLRIGKLTGQKININISDASKNGTYEPYIKHTYPLDSDLTLRGIVMKDANNNLYYDGDTYESDGSVKRRYGIVDLGSLTWVKGNMNTANTGRIFYSVLSSSPMKQPSDNGIVSDKLVYNPFSNWSAGQWERQILNGITVTNSAALVACAPDNYSTASDFKTAMNGVYLVYELATPTTETATPYTNPQLVGSTEEFIDAGTSASTPTRDVDIPVGQDSKYVNGNIYIKYLDSVTTGDIELADENAIIPLDNTTYISSNGSASIDYWKYVVTHMSTKNVNANGTYEAPIGEAYNKLIVNLPNGTNTEY